MRKRNILIIAIVLMAVGFAVVTTNLVINGQTSIGSTAFEVVFTKAVIDGEDISSTAISKSGVELTFETKELTTVGETSTLEFIVTNMSRQYDGTVTINCPKGDNGEYYTIETEFPESIKAGSSEYGTLKVTYSKGSPNKIQEEITCSLTFNANEKTKEEIDTGEIYQDETLNGADPVLKKAIATFASVETAESTKELIPVVISDDGTVKYANIHTRWYSYENKEWANAVILTDEAQEYKVGDTIPEDDIESYFVWIPKYSYQIWDLGYYDDVSELDESKVHSIPIRFGTENTNDEIVGECTTPGYNEETGEYDSSNVAGESGNCQVGDYMTHPAFLAFDTTGLWVGKFETGYKGAKKADNARKNAVDISKIIIKPNVYSWREINTGNSFKNSYEYQRNLNSHMMKNTEWGAVVYLSHSDYGISSEMASNRNESYKTGYANTNSKYNTVAGYKASTTGNITGIYDMAGGSQDAVMAYSVNSNQGVGADSGLIDLYDDFFDNSEWNKYYDLYTSYGRHEYYNRILGDATGELGPFIYPSQYVFYSSWYSDFAWFIEPRYPFVCRSGSWVEEHPIKMFYFNATLGEESEYISFRIVLAV